METALFLYALALTIYVTWLTRRYLRLLHQHEDAETIECETAHMAEEIPECGFMVPLRVDGRIAFSPCILTAHHDGLHVPEKKDLVQLQPDHEKTPQPVRDAARTVVRRTEQMGNRTVHYEEGPTKPMGPNPWA